MSLKDSIHRAIHDTMKGSNYKSFNDFIQMNHKVEELFSEKNAQKKTQYFFCITVFVKKKKKAQ